VSHKIIVNPEVLSPSYLPEKLLHRNKEQAQLIRNIKNSVNTFLYGSPSSGKTSLIRRTIQDSSFKKEKLIYIDCRLYQTTNSILREILYALNVPFFCRSNYELVNILRKKTKDHKLVACLDHFKRLREVELVDKLLSIDVCVIVVSDRKESFMRLDPATRASFTLMRIPKYSIGQVFDIIKARAEQALRTGSYSDEVIRKIAKRSNGDVSLAINMLKTAALKAESEKRSKIEVDDIPRSDCPRLELSYDERVLLNILE